MDLEVIAEELGFPEGPIAMADGSVLLVEIRSGTLSRIASGKRKEIIANLGGGPNGAAIGPDGAVYVTNNGGFAWRDLPDGTMLPNGIPEDYVSGSIQRVSLKDGAVTTLFTECDGKRLNGPNDLVFDATGGFYFTDLGKSTQDWSQYGYLYYAVCDGSRIVRLRGGLSWPNGVGLSPDGKAVYVAESMNGRLWAFDIVSPGVLKPPPNHWMPGRLVWSAPGYQLFDSMAVEENGNICVATVVNGGISVVSPDGDAEHIPIPSTLVTNICFGGPDMRTAWITAGDSGKLFKMTWARPGLRLNFNV